MIAKRKRWWLALNAVALAVLVEGDCKAQYLGMSGGSTRSSYNGGFGGLEGALNAVDTTAGWARTPVSTGIQQRPVYYQNGQPRAASSQSRSAGVPPAPSGQMLNAMQGMFPGVSRQEMMRCFFEGGSPTMSGGAMQPPPADQSGKTSIAYQNYQTACNEEAKARNDAGIARYNQDQWSRKNAASQAEYAANNAEYAAERAESAAYSGGAQARSYAGLARQAANRARESANQARYNADTMR